MPNEPIDFDKIAERVETFLDSRDELRHLVPGFNAVRDAVQKAAAGSNNPAPVARRTRLITGRSISGSRSG